MNITCQDLLSLIFDHLTDGEKRVCARVCQRWRQVWIKWIIRCVAPVCAKYRLGFSQSQLIQHMSHARIEWCYDEVDYMFECYEVAKILTGPRSIIKYELAERNVDLTLLPDTIDHNYGSVSDPKVQELARKIILAPPATQTYHPDIIPLFIYDWNGNRTKFPLIISSTGDVWYGDELLLSYSDVRDMIVSGRQINFLRKDNCILMDYDSLCSIEKPLGRLGYHTLITEIGQVIIKFSSLVETNTENIRQAACVRMSFSQDQYHIFGEAISPQGNINYVLFLLNEEDVLSFALVLSNNSSTSKHDVIEYPLMQAVKNFTHVTFKHHLDVSVCLVERYDGSLEILSYYMKDSENRIDDYRLSYPNSPLFSYRVRSVNVCDDTIYLFTCDDRVIQVDVLGMYSEGLSIICSEETTFMPRARCGAGRFAIAHN